MWAAPAAALVALAVSSFALAQSPPQPDFFWPYGTVLHGATNLDPVDQPLVSIVRGQACGVTRPLVATAQTGTPAGDVGKTVYAIDVLADGSGSGQIPGCGRTGDAVLFYLPAAGLVSTQQPLFHAGDERVDLTMDTSLSVRLVLPVVSDDGPLQ